MELGSVVPLGTGVPEEWPKSKKKDSQFDKGKPLRNSVCGFLNGCSSGIICGKNLLGRGSWN